MGLHEPAQAFAGQGTIGDDAHSFRAVGDLPRFANRPRRGEGFLEKPLQVASTPNALLEDGLERQGIEHRLRPPSAAFPGNDRGLETWRSASSIVRWSWAFATAR